MKSKIKFHLILLLKYYYLFSLSLNEKIDLQEVEITEQRMV